MRRIVKTTKTPEDSFFRTIEASIRLKGIVDFQKQALKKWKGISNLPNRITEAMERSWSDSAIAGDWMGECCSALIEQLKNEHGIELLKEIYGWEEGVGVTEDLDCSRKLLIGSNKYSIRQVALATLLANTICDPLVSYYSLWGAKELSPSHQLLEEFTLLDSDYDFESLPFLSWVSLKGFGLKSSVSKFIKDHDKLDLTLTEDIVGVMIVNLNEVYKRSLSLLNPLKMWDEIAYVLGDNFDNSGDCFKESYKDGAYKDHVLFCLFTSNSPLRRSTEIVHNGTLLVPFDQAEEQISLISEGLGESLSAMFMPGCGRRTGVEEELSSGQDFSDFGLAFDLALKTIKYSQDTEKVFTSSNYPHPIQPSNQSSNGKRKKKGKKVKVKNITKYFQIEYLKMPREDNFPQWFKKDYKRSTPRAKSIDPRFMSSHYRRIWVVDSYISKKGIPEEQILAVDENRPRYNKNGDLIYKKRSLVAIKIDTGHEPEAVVTRMS